MQSPIKTPANTNKQSAHNPVQKKNATPAKKLPAVPVFQLLKEPETTTGREKQNILSKTSNRNSIEEQKTSMAATTALDKMLYQRKALPAVPPFQSGDGVIQRETIDEYLDGVQKTASKERWDPDYEEDLDAIASAIKSQINQAIFSPKYLQRPVGAQLETRKIVLVKKGKVSVNEEVSDENWMTFINQLALDNLISKSDFDVYKYLIGIGDKPGRGGLRSLKFEKNKLVGRPAFDEETQALIKPRAKHHRRHIIAWHNIQAFANVVFTQFNGKVSEMLNPILEKLSHLAIYARTVKKVEDLKLNDKEKEKLLIAVFIMNSNTENLWPGPGKENSGINTASITLNKEMNKWKTIKQMIEALDQWNIDKSKQNTVPKIAKAIAFAFTCNILSNALNTHAPQKASQKQGLILREPEKKSKKVDTPKPSQSQNLSLAKGTEKKVVEDAPKPLPNILINNESLVQIYSNWQRFVSSSNSQFEVDNIQKLVIKDTKSSIREWIISHLEFDVGFTEADTKTSHEKKATGLIPIFFNTLFKGGALKDSEIKEVFTTLLTLPEGFKKADM